MYFLKKVFPACGHVHGYHVNLIGRPCPMCRTVGPFVPIAFAFEPAVCQAKPTHVFNPCGHAASRTACQVGNLAYTWSVYI